MKPPETIDCPDCGKPATYQGTQDRLAIYTCPDGHLTRRKP